MGNLLSSIPFVSTLAEKVPSMDYEGQKQAERLYQCVIVLFAVVGFIWGYICQQFAQTVIILAAGVLLAVLLVVPPWPMFRKHPLPWSTPQDQKPSSPSRTTSTPKKREKTRS